MTDHETPPASGAPASTGPNPAGSRTAPSPRTGAAPSATVPAAAAPTAPPPPDTLEGVRRSERLPREYHYRLQLANEIHARPPLDVRPPLRASHMALLLGEGGGHQSLEDLKRLCHRLGAAVPSDNAAHYIADFGTFRLKWERHTEFCTFTIFRMGRFKEPFDAPAIEAVPTDWLASLSGQMLVGAHLAFEDDVGEEPDADTLSGLFGASNIIGSRVSGDAATVWTDFRLHADGFSRILIQDRGLRAASSGRLVQRLLEIETYRLMALIAFPIARETARHVNDTDEKLGRIMAEMADVTARGVDEESRMLRQLTEIAAEAEKRAASTTYRFGAARAYHAIVNQRIAELRENRIEGLSTIEEFLGRRLSPAMATCESTEVRQASVLDRVSRAANLLRARVDVGMEGQNRDLLASMDKRARLQVRLQETVESLSVAAISYYLVGLIAYVIKGLDEGGALPMDGVLLVGLLTPVVVAAIWVSLKVMRKRLFEKEGAD